MEIDVDMEIDIEIGHFDDSEEFDDSLYYAPTIELPYQVVTKPTPKIETVFGMIPEVLTQIVLHCYDMKTFVYLSTTSKSIQKLYSKALWIHKFNQYKVKTETIPKSFGQCMNLLRSNTIYNLADMFISSRFGPYGNYDVKLHMELPSNVFETIMASIGYNKKFKNYTVRNTTAYNLDVYFGPLTVNIKNYKITREKFREFIFILYRDGYLHKKWTWVR